MAGDREGRFERHGSSDAGDVVKLLEAAMRIVKLDARLDRLEASQNAILETLKDLVANRGDWTADEEREIVKRLDHLETVMAKPADDLPIPMPPLPPTT